MKAQVLKDNGSYEKVDRRGKELFHSQETFCKEAIEAATESKEENITDSRVFTPERHID